MDVRVAAPEGWSVTRIGFVAWLTGLTASLFNLLNFHNYTRPGPEIAILIAVFIVIAAVMAGVHKIAQPRLSFIITALFLAVLIDLNTEIPRWWFFGIVALFALAAYFREAVVLKLTIAAFGTVLFFQAASLYTGIGKSAEPPNEAKIPQSHAKADRRLRPIVHLVLDSYVGIEGMTVPGSNFGTLAEEQSAFYRQHGFQVYPQTYSKHVKTVNSLPYFFSYRSLPVVTEPRAVDFTVAPRLDYFTDLDRAGYRVSALTPSYVDLCTNQPLTECHNFNRSDLGSLLSTDLSSGERAQLIGFNLMMLSAFSSTVADFVYDQLVKTFDLDWRSPYNRAKLLPLSSVQKLDAVTRELGTLEYGEARVVHLLLPHDPYLLAADCHVLPEREWLDEHGPSPLDVRDAAYANQVRCMTKRLDAMLAALERTPAGRDAIVIIQGDHGSRTVDTVPFVGGPELSLRDIALSHLAFFAIRVPGEPAASIPGRFSLDALLGDFARSGFTASPHPPERPAEVYVMDINWVPQNRVPLPKFGRK